jgi:MtN3 and saliva related transmembrane protein
MTELIGYLAAIITTACYVPQALHVIRSRQTAGISLLAYSMLFAGVGLWALYGVLIGDWPLILANGVSIVLIGTILAMKIRLG